MKANEEYIFARNKKIAEAEQFADNLMKDIDRGEQESKQRDDWNGAWNLAFHSKMNELCKDL